MRGFSYLGTACTVTTAGRRLDATREVTPSRCEREDSAPCGLRASARVGERPHGSVAIPPLLCRMKTLSTAVAREDHPSH